MADVTGVDLSLPPEESGVLDAEYARGRVILECGSGGSTRIAAAAASLDGGPARLMETAAEELRRDRFAQSFALSRAQLELRIARERAGSPPN